MPSEVLAPIQNILAEAGFDPTLMFPSGKYWGMVYKTSSNEPSLTLLFCYEQERLQVATMIECKKMSLVIIEALKSLKDLTGLDVQPEVDRCGIQTIADSTGDAVAIAIRHVTALATDLQLFLKVLPEVPTIKDPHTLAHLFLEYRPEYDLPALVTGQARDIQVPPLAVHQAFAAGSGK